METVTIRKSILNAYNRKMITESEFIASIFEEAGMELPKQLHRDLCGNPVITKWAEESAELFNLKYK